jgi:hypothetical protein
MDQKQPNVVNVRNGPSRGRSRSVSRSRSRSPPAAREPRDEEGGEWSEPSDWLQTPDAARVYELSGRSKVRAADGTSHARTAVDYRPALANDPDYVQGAAVGGLGVSGWNSAENDGDGGGGLVVVAAYTGLAAHPIPHSRQVFFASRVAQTYAVPSRHSGRPGARRVIVKAWGGGGGAGAGRGEQNKTSRATESQTDYIQRDRFWGRGGGGGFARASLSVTPGDALEILVGGGGGGAVRGKPGVGGWHGGASGGAGEWGGGGGGGMSLVKLNGQTMLVAGGGGGGGGGGATDYCCAHGGGGGGLVGGNGSAPGLETPVDIAPYNARRHEHSRPPPSYADLLLVMKKPDPKWIRF